MPSAIAIQFKEVYLDGKWVVNTNLASTLKAVTYYQATTTLGSHNSIAALTFHLNYYIAGILSAMQTGQLVIEDRYSFDMPDINHTEDWHNLRQTTLDNILRMSDNLEAMSEATFEGPFIDKKYGTWKRNIQVMIEHGYYHLGQIVMLTKLIPQDNN